jgi:hypothetical protein
VFAINTFFPRPSRKRRMPYATSAARQSRRAIWSVKSRQRMIGPAMSCGNSRMYNAKSKSRRSALALRL